MNLLSIFTTNKLESLYKVMFDFGMCVRVRMCMCVCVCASVCACVCVCVLLVRFSSALCTALCCIVHARTQNGMVVATRDVHTCAHMCSDTMLTGISI